MGVKEQTDGCRNPLERIIDKGQKQKKEHVHTEERLHDSSIKICTEKEYDMKRVSDTYGVDK